MTSPKVQFYIALKQKNDNMTELIKSPSKAECLINKKNTN
jgi:hypothetical protein